MSLPQGFDNALKSKNEIIRNLAETINNIVEIPGADLVAEKFAKLHAGLIATADGIKEEDVSNIKNTFDDYLKEVNDFIKNQGDKFDPAVLCCLQDSQIVLKAYKEDIKPGNKLDDIYSDISWSKNLLNTQEYKPTAEVPKDLSAALNDWRRKSIEKSLDQYKESAEYIKKYRMGYLSHVAYGSKNPIETISYRTFLLDSAINAVNNGGEFEPISPMLEHSFEVMHGGFTLDNPDNIKLSKLYSKSNIAISFDYSSSINDSIDRADNLVKNKKVSPQKEEEVKGILNQYSTLKQKTKHLGLDDKKIKKIDWQIKPVSVIQNMLLAFKNNNPERNLEEDKALHEIVKAANDISRATAEYLSGKPDAKAPTEDMFKPLISALKEYATNYDNYLTVFNGRLIGNNDINTCAGILSIIGENLDDLRANVNDALGEIQKKCKRAFVEDLLTNTYKFEEKYRDQKFGFDSQKYNIDGNFGEALLKDEVSYLDSKLVSQEDVDLGKILMLLTDDNYRNELIEKSSAYFENNQGKEKDDTYDRQLRNLLLASELKSQYEKCNGGEYETKSLILNPYSGLILDIYENGAEGDNRKYLMAYYDSFFNNEAVMDLLNKNPEDISKLVKEGKLQEYLDLNLRKDSLDLMTDVDKESLEVFTQTDNSDEFKAIQNALKKINGFFLDPYKVKPEDYFELFNSCKDYVNTRSLSAKTEVERQRFKAASIIMQDIGLKLMDKAPGQKEEIEKEMKLTALRSSEFRNRLEEKTADNNLKNFAKLAKETLGNKDIDDIIKSKADAEKLLDKYISFDRKRVNEEKIQPALKSAWERFKKDVNISDDKKRIEAMTYSLAKVIYYNSFSKLTNKIDEKDNISQKKFDSYLSKDFYQNSIKIIKNITKDYVTSIPASDFKAMINSPSFKDKLISGFNKYLANREKKIEISESAITGKDNKDYLFGTPCSDLELVFGVTSGNHVAHILGHDGPGLKGTEITEELMNNDKPRDITRELTQAEVYSNESDLKTKEKFLAIGRKIAEEYEKDGITDPEKNVLIAIKDYLMAASHSSQQNAITKINVAVKKFNDYQNKIKQNKKSAPALIDKLNNEKAFVDKIVKDINANFKGNLDIPKEEEEYLKDQKIVEPGSKNLFDKSGIWQKSYKQLFPHEPSPNDIKQGLGVMDCYMLSPLIQLAEKNPKFIRESMKDNDDGTVTVRFFNKNNGNKPTYVRVNKTVNQSVFGQNYYAASSLWVQMLEKAWVKYVEQNMNTDRTGHDFFENKSGSFKAIDRSNASEFLNAFTPGYYEIYEVRNPYSTSMTTPFQKYCSKEGFPKQYLPDEEMLFDCYDNLIKKGEIISVGITSYKVRGEKFDYKEHGIRPGHAYTVRKFVKRNGKLYVQLRDPYASFKAGYDKNGNIVNQSHQVKGFFTAGNDNMGTFELEFRDFNLLFDQYTGISRDALDQIKNVEYYDYSEKGLTDDELKHGVNTNIARTKGQAADVYERPKKEINSILDVSPNDVAWIDSKRRMIIEKLSTEAGFRDMQGKLRKAYNDLMSTDEFFVWTNSEEFNLMRDKLAAVNKMFSAQEKNWAKNGAVDQKKLRAIADRMMDLNEFSRAYLSVKEDEIKEKKSVSMRAVHRITAAMNIEALTDLAEPLTEWQGDALEKIKIMINDMDERIKHLETQKIPKKDLDPKQYKNNSDRDLALTQNMTNKKIKRWLEKVSKLLNTCVNDKKIKLPKEDYERLIGIEQSLKEKFTVVNMDDFDKNMQEKVAPKVGPNVEKIKKVLNLVDINIRRMIYGYIDKMKEGNDQLDENDIKVQLTGDAFIKKINEFNSINTPDFDMNNMQIVGPSFALAKMIKDNSSDEIFKKINGSDEKSKEKNEMIDKFNDFYEKLEAAVKQNQKDENVKEGEDPVKPATYSLPSA